jgi:hypothetical protein
LLLNVHTAILLLKTICRNSIFKCKVVVMDIVYWMRIRIQSQSLVRRYILSVWGCYKFP